jgi:hypothetical protein
MYMTQYVLLGIEFSEKSGIYLLSVQLLLCDGIKSVLPSLAGIITGYLYYRNYCGLQQRLVLPKFFDVSFVRHFLIYYLLSVSQKFFRLLNVLISSFNPPADQAQQSRGGSQRARQPSQPANQPRYQQQQQQQMFEQPPPDEESIQTLMVSQIF